MSDSVGELFVEVGGNLVASECSHLFLTVGFNVVALACLYFRSVKAVMGIKGIMCASVFFLHSFNFKVLEDAIARLRAMLNSPLGYKQCHR